MKKLILFLALIAFTGVAFAQTDSTYTTFSSTTINGSEGSDTCTHEWFTTVTDNTDTVTHTRVQVTSKQCVKCGKQISVENIWKTYLKEDENEGE